MAMPTKCGRRRPMAEMNVVPYIDVMLVLLVIFMITAPMLTQGVNVDLPQASSQPIPPEQEEPLIVSVDAKGNYYVDIGDNKKEPVSGETLVNRVAAVMRRSPNRQVLIKGDKTVDYGAVVQAMALLQEAGVPKVGLMTKPADDR